MQLWSTHPSAWEGLVNHSPGLDETVGNMAVIRHFAFNLLRIVDDKRSIKLRRKRAARNNQYLAEILQQLRR